MSNNRQALVDAGWNTDMAEALDGNNHTAETAKHLSTEEVFGIFLLWNGIIGYTSMITNAIDNCRNQEAV